MLQKVAGAMAAAAITNAVAVTAVDLTRSFAFVGGLGQGGSAGGRTDYAATDRVGEALAQAVMTSNVQLTFTRQSSTAAAAWIGYVVQLTP